MSILKVIINRLGSTATKRHKQKKLSKSVKLERERARRLVYEKLEYWNSYYNFSYKRIAIRDQKTRWGSCSSKKNLNFNYRILYLPEELQDYLIVHELCHVAEMNHGRNYWRLVSRTQPDYKKQGKALRRLRPYSVRPIH